MLVTLFPNGHAGIKPLQYANALIPNARNAVWDGNAG